MERRPILVTGASGVLGRSILTTFIEAGLPVRQAVRNPEKARYGVDWVRLDYSEPATMGPALAGASGLLLIAPPLDPEAPAKVGPLIELSGQAGIRSVTFISAFGVNHDEQAPLRIVERQLMGSGIPYCILRPNFFMENFSEGFLSQTIKRQNGIFLAAGEGRTSFISVKDIASVAVRCFKEGDGKTELDLTGPEALDHAEAAATISSVSGRPVSYHPLSDEQMAAGARAAGVPESAISYMLVLYGAVRAGYAAGVTGHVEQVLHRPPMTFNDFAEQSAAAWMKGEGK